MPAPTAWPFVFAVGLALIFAGLLTSAWVSVLGAVFWIFGAVGWFRQVLPHEHHEEIPVLLEAAPVVATIPEVARLQIADDVPRAWLPLKIYPISAGVKGGWPVESPWRCSPCSTASSSFTGIWYPVNLLAGSLYAAPAIPSMDALLGFHPGWLLFALALHLTMCLLVGLLYGAMLPMLPTRPIVLGGIIAPLLWTGLLYQVLGFVNPLLEKRSAGFGSPPLRSHSEWWPGWSWCDKNKVWTTEEPAAGGSRRPGSAGHYAFPRPRGP